MFKSRSVICIGRTLIIAIMCAVIFSVSLNVINAHPGNTASDGCHYCRTNCDYWGVAWYERHCHFSYPPPPPPISYTYKYMTSSIPYSTKIELDKSLNEDRRIVKRPGVAGEKKSAYKVRLYNGIATSETLEYTRTIKEPISEIIVKGTAKVNLKDDPPAQEGNSSQKNFSAYAGAVYEVLGPQWTLLLVSGFFGIFAYITYSMFNKKK